ncbi:MAG: hypothetical protein JXB17_08155 [Bacteroidales bacterium]|nr:hypothetical protein [Bacteroidales bacterium]
MQNKKFRSRLKTYLTIILIISNLVCVLGQTVEETFNYANIQYKAKNFELAIPAYRRILFFDENRFNRETYLQLAHCYFELGIGDKAHYYYDIAYNIAEDDSIKAIIIFQKTLLYLLSGENKYARVEIENLKNIENEEIMNRSNFYKGVVYYKNDFISDSKEFFLSNSKFSEKEKATIDSLFVEYDLISRINPQAARYLSAIVPGSGQLYTGHYNEALNSFLLTAAFFVLFQYTAINYSLLDAALAVLPWYQRYFMGGTEQAANLAINKIEKRKSEVLNEIIDVYK